MYVHIHQGCRIQFPRYPTVVKRRAGENIHIRVFQLRRHDFTRRGIPDCLFHQGKGIVNSGFQDAGSIFFLRLHDAHNRKIFTVCNQLAHISGILTPVSPDIVLFVVGEGIAVVYEFEFDTKKFFICKTQPIQILSFDVKPADKFTDKTVNLIWISQSKNIKQIVADFSFACEDKDALVAVFRPMPSFDIIAVYVQALCLRHTVKHIGTY